MNRTISMIISLVIAIIALGIMLFFVFKTLF